MIKEYKSDLILGSMLIYVTRLEKNNISVYEKGMWEILISYKVVEN